MECVGRRKTGRSLNSPPRGSSRIVRDEGDLLRATNNADLGSGLDEREQRFNVVGLEDSTDTPVGKLRIGDSQLCAVVVIEFCDDVCQRVVLENKTPLRPG